MNRREFGKKLAAGLGSTLLTPALASAAAAAGSTGPRRPNLVFVLSDQHSYKYCGCMGDPVVRTPNLDRLAQHGALFRSTYCGNPVCSPSRAGMISGVFPSDVNSFCNATTWDGSLPAWPALLRDAGYRTFGCGKMDTDAKFDLGFTEEHDLANQHAKKPDITAFFRRPLCARPDERNIVNGRARKDRHKDEKHAAATIEFIRRQAEKGPPWAAYCGWHMPHPSFQGLEEHFNYYLSRVTLPRVSADELEGQHFVFQQLRHFKNIATPIPEERIRRARAAYFAMITELDEYLGRIWRTLEETGQLDNTIFIYSSDHGESLGEHGLWLKNNLYDVAARVPLVMAGAGIPRGVVVDTPVSHCDLIRTFLEWGGARTHAKLRGHSLVPLMRGERGDHPGWAYSESHSEGNCTGSFMVRKGDWKYISFTWHEGLLFNLRDDPGELRNRIADPAAKAVLEELTAILRSQVDPVEVTQRAFAAQRKRLDRLAEGLTPDQMLDQFRNRLGEGQAVALLTAYYGRTFNYEHKQAKEGADSEG